MNYKGKINCFSCERVINMMEWEKIKWLDWRLVLKFLIFCLVFILIELYGVSI